jgi:hypothetical protein
MDASMPSQLSTVHVDLQDSVEVVDVDVDVAVDLPFFFLSLIICVRLLLTSSGFSVSLFAHRPFGASISTVHYQMV